MDASEIRENDNDGFPFLWDEIKIPIQYGSNYNKAFTIIEEVGRKTSQELIVKSKAVWEQMQTKFRVEDVHVEPIVNMIAHDAYVEFTLRYIVEHERLKRTKVKLFTKILKEIINTNGEIRFASTVFSIKKPFW
jgi:small-conductance mechanosensitive channel